jgi:phosphoglycolate phosphatase-like HAD superfamily hydrolase
VHRLLLWDIDGTLIHGGGVGGRAINAAARAVAQLAEVPVVDIHGKTDPQILREIFEAADVHADHIEGHVEAAVEDAVRRLAATEAEPRAKGGTHPGVVEVLAALDALEGVTQTLLTGNIVGNSAIKLAAFDLTRWFDEEIGAYGTDHADRLELVPIALERSARLRGETYEPDEVWVIGDTANDLACARAGGVRCLLVGTGAPGWDGVKDLDAEAVLPDLSDVAEVVRILTS